ncbi:MAG TPA: hypothetical protein DDY68_05190 [Porphyromonadaceae bacterium]|nr:hypothetical protein [Porphyromonadaceae bacterium]
MIHTFYTLSNCCFKVEGEELVQLLSKEEAFKPFEGGSEEGKIFEIHYSSSRTIFSLEDTLFEHTGEDFYFSFSRIEGSGGYFAQIITDNGEETSLWREGEDSVLFLQGAISSFAVSFLLRVGFGLITNTMGRIAIHGSCVVKEGNAYLFLGESGIGKSTHSRLWIENIENTFLLNDDSPIIHYDGEEVWIYGSPWSGKTPCYKNERYPLKGCARITQAPHNKIVALERVIDMYSAIHPSCPPEFSYEENLYNGISRTIEGMISSIKVFRLECLPNEEAAMISYQALCKE